MNAGHDADRQGDRQDTEQQGDASRRAAMEGSANRRRILVVNDDLGMLRTTALILERKGYAVPSARDGAVARESVRQ
jgi:PleD family two-component response regulator